MEKGKMETEDRIKATIYGQCIGDAIGLLTEFLNQKEAKTYYGKVSKHLKYEHKALCPDMHRTRWDEGDWTDDSDQMILILQSLLDNSGKVLGTDFGEKLLFWADNGFPELGDKGGMGIGNTTNCVLHHKEYKTDPHKAARDVWESSGRNVAPNGGVMRTSILGTHQFWDTETVVANALEICKTTHHDPRCQASCVAVVAAISLMLQRRERHVKKKGTYRVDDIILDSYTLASKCLQTEKEKEELWKHMTCIKLSDLDLSERGKIGYTYKCMGSGFWALKQKDFTKAIQELVMEAGDADTNCSVAGAMLGCKLGLNALPERWLKLKHRSWLDEKINKFLILQTNMRSKV